MKCDFLPLAPEALVMIADPREPGRHRLFEFRRIVPATPIIMANVGPKVRSA